MPTNSCPESSKRSYELGMLMFAAAHKRWRRVATLCDPAVVDATELLVLSQKPHPLGSVTLGRPSKKKRTKQCEAFIPTYIVTYINSTLCVLIAIIYAITCIGCMRLCELISG